MEKNLFSREDPRIVKAAAALMMIAHHLFAFPRRLPTGYAYSSVFPSSFLSDFGSFCLLFISLFFFVGGYGLYKQYEAGKASLPRILGRQYAQYWKVFIIFVPIGLIFFRNQPVYCADTTLSSRYDQPTLKLLVSNLIGLSSDFNREWWFLKSYLLVSFVGLAFIVCWLELVSGVPHGIGRKVFGFIGRESANFWLTHSFFCYYFYPAVMLVYWSENPILVFLTATGLTLAASLGITHLYRGLAALGKRSIPKRSLPS